MRRKTRMMTGFVAVAQLVFLLAGCGVFLDDISFARRALTMLVEGRYDVRHMIDWDNFRALGEDVSAPYKAIQTAKSKVDYQRVFVVGFSKGFQEQKADIKAFYNWKNYKTTAEKISIVVANCRTENMLLLFYLKPTKWGGKKLIGINALISQGPVRMIPEEFEDYRYFPPKQEADKQALEQRVLEQNLATDAAEKIQEEQQAQEEDTEAPVVPDDQTEEAQ